jgi:hypothetical protein
MILLHNEEKFLQVLPLMDSGSLYRKGPAVVYIVSRLCSKVMLFE